MVRPLIGIAAARNTGIDGRERFGCGVSYVAQIERAGGLAVLLPPPAGRHRARAAIEAVDGLLIPGGGDIVLSAFDGKRHRKPRSPDLDRDRADIAAIRQARRRGVPILGICYGVQILNFALGGGLIEHIPAEVAGAIQHDSQSSLVHTIETEPGSLIARLIGRKTIKVNSRHHQAVGRTARGMRATARAADGVIEAIEAGDGRPILGVQFHPEDIADRRHEFRAIFDWLVREARRFRRSRPKS